MRIFAALLLLGLASEGWTDEFFINNQFSSQDLNRHKKYTRLKVFL